MDEVLEVKVREGRGTRDAKRLRREGRVPAVLYGHGEETVSLSVSSEGLDTVLRHGARVIDLTGAVSQTALIRDVQWDTYGIDIIHVDFARVSAREVVTTTIQLELRGEAPGTKEGGVVEQPLHELAVDLPAINVTDRISVSINDLHLNGVIKVSDLALPEGAKPHGDPDAIVAQCVEPKEEVESEVVTGLEPEVIGQKKEDEE